MAENLYNKYGGFATVSHLVQNFYGKVLASQSLKPYFNGIDMPKLMKHQTAFLCSVLGGPASYDGQTLAAAHKNLKITAAAFGEVAELLQETLEDANVSDEDVKAIIGIVATTQNDIVTH